MPYETFHTLVLSAETGETGVELTATEENTEFVLVCPFVSSVSTTALTNDYRLPLSLWTNPLSNTGLS